MEGEAAASRLPVFAGSSFCGSKEVSRDCGENILAKATIHGPKRGWVLALGDFQHCSCCSQTLLPRLSVSVKVCDRKAPTALCSDVLEGPRLGKTAGSERISETAPGGEGSALPVHTSLVRSPEEKQTLICDGTT